jgi:ribosome-binding protein aMBF1 (putative translation factor)
MEFGKSEEQNSTWCIRPPVGLDPPRRAGSPVRADRLAAGRRRTTLFSGMRAPDTIDRELLGRFGARTKAMRLAKGMTQIAFAEQVGFDRNYWGRVERGQQNVSISTLSRIARVLGVTMRELVDGL